MGPLLAEVDFAFDPRSLVIKRFSIPAGVNGFIIGGIYIYFEFVFMYYSMKTFNSVNLIAIKALE